MSPPPISKTDLSRFLFELANLSVKFEKFFPTQENVSQGQQVIAYRGTRFRFKLRNFGSKTPYLLRILQILTATCQGFQEESMNDSS